MVRRGAGQGTIDQTLYKQCLGAGVEFKFGQSAPENSDVFATGTGKAAAFITGLNFRTDLPDQVHLLLGRRFAPKGYAYLIILHGSGTLAAAFKKNQDQSDPLQEARSFFCDRGLPIPHGKPFTSRGSFAIPFGKKMGGVLRIGEAGGYQDYLFGFGMRMAMASGAVAAWRILGTGAKARRTLKLLERKRKLSFVNRFLFERLNDNQLRTFSEKLSRSSDPLAILSGAYTWNFKNLIRWINVKNRFEVRFH